MIIIKSKKKKKPEYRTEFDLSKITLPKPNTNDKVGIPTINWFQA